MSPDGVLRVLVLFGGRSGEHEVSVLSARPVVAAVEELGHEVIAVGIGMDGGWVRCDPRRTDRVTDGDAFSIVIGGDAEPVADVAFPVLHGPGGEDGSIQGALELARLPYVGSGVAGSAVGIDKVIQKRLFAEAGLPVVEFVSFTRERWARDAAAVRKEVAGLGYPCFAKPVTLGSSVGISKVNGADALDDALRRALTHDDDVIVEAAGFSRELEVGVLGDPPRLSCVGEIVPDGEFYDYRAKYKGAQTQLQIPADVPVDVTTAVQELALRAFRVAGCEGFARVDFFFDAATGSLILNEVNTIPGLTPASMFPKLWEASGVTFTDVVGELLDHACARARGREALDVQRRSSHDAETN